MFSMRFTKTRINFFNPAFKKNVYEERILISSNTIFRKIYLLKIPDAKLEMNIEFVLAIFPL